ncbi:putative bifunctional diguanylate cyclase/phosphodiesterase [Saccharopolyspora mangrovi]|uniref:GGDEF domain-containing protein n=1 Tax=Saccharopolyspora mangrovi TaxID=3082379 RepID=A0ABU6ADS5_9PSEU|nr:GGDEF domain-containing protein [Saccharopolyspora sp. S2-29]MEB3369702.1 GGDEF domain-containing protein [Saccharopolyspora sp. S2-29]
MSVPGSGTVRAPVTLSDMILSTDSLEDFLDEVISRVAGVGSEALSCGLTVPGDGGQAPFTFRASDAFAAGLDEMQQVMGDGPGPQALRTGEIVMSDSLGRESRWPEFVQHALDVGARSVLSVPLLVRGSVVASLNVYDRSEGGISPVLPRVAMFAEEAAGAVAIAAKLDQHLRTSAELRLARTREASEWHQQATHDELTGLPNRRGVRELLDSLLANGIRAKVAVLYCDLDNFKRVNGGLGHEAGDELLLALAHRLSTGLPARCTPARISGDEFVIVCSDVDAVGGLDALTAEVSDLLRAAIPVRGHVVLVSAAVGAAVDTGTGTTGDDLLRFADAAMFEAKNAGPGQVSHAHPALMTTVNRQLHLETDLRDAIAQGGVELHYQPIVDSTGTVIMAEALLRWSHPEHGVLPPDLVLEVAEGGDLVGDLDRYVLRRALAEAATWPPPRPAGVAINLSGLLPDTAGFADEISDAIDESGLDWQRVVLEITETPLAGLTDRAYDSMGQLAKNGLRFAVDDFGTGYSSLSRLKDVPTQLIKIDRHFVAGMATNHTDQVLTEAVIGMANATGHTCIAEGVETAAQFQHLDQLGCQAYQGWYFSRALPAAEFRALLSRGALGTLPQ